VKFASSIKEACWTLLGFTNAKGKPVLCTIIFASETIIAKETLGFDIFAEVKGDLSDIKSNYGPGKVYPGAPKCSISGKEVPAFISCTSKGSITSELLKKCWSGLISIMYLKEYLTDQLHFCYWMVTDRG